MRATPNKDPDDVWPGVTWRYLAAGNVKHAVRVNPAISELADRAECGVRPTGVEHTWLGHGSPVEERRLMSTPPCEDCARALMSIGDEL